MLSRHMAVAARARDAVRAPLGLPPTDVTFVVMSTCEEERLADMHFYVAGEDEDDEDAGGDASRSEEEREQKRRLLKEEQEEQKITRIARSPGGVASFSEESESDA